MATTTTIITKQGDTKITFMDSPTIDGVPVAPTDLTGCTLRFLMKSTDPTIVPPIQIAQPATINPDATFQYNPVPADVATVGKFQQEWEVTYPSAKILTFPNNGYNIVKIIADLG